MFFLKKKINMDVEILFHTETNPYGSHGEIIISHKDKNYTHKAIRFVFKGMVNPPALTPNVIKYIFDKAEDKGYMPFELIRYGKVIDVVCNPDNQSNTIERTWITNNVDSTFSEPTKRNSLISNFLG